MTHDQLTAVAYIFERHNGRTLSSSESRHIEENQYTDKDPEGLKEEILNFLASPKVGRDERIHGYWVLGKKRDRSLLDYFIGQLEVEVSRDVRVGYQIMIALEDIDESVFCEDRSGYSFDEDELNKRDALEYLSQKGRTRQLS